MGMTIDEAVDRLEDLRVEHDDWTEDGLFNREALRQAIKTMRKYQKIEQILDDWINDDSVGMSDYWMGKIKKVIENENNNRNQNYDFDF